MEPPLTPGNYQQGYPRSATVTVTSGQGDGVREMEQQIYKHQRTDIILPTRQLGNPGPTALAIRVYCLMVLWQKTVLVYLMRL